MGRFRDASGLSAAGGDVFSPPGGGFDSGFFAGTLTAGGFDSAFFAGTLTAGGFGSGFFAGTVATAGAFVAGGVAGGRARVSGARDVRSSTGETGFGRFGAGAVTSGCTRACGVGGGVGGVAFG